MKRGEARGLGRAGRVQQLRQPPDGDTRSPLPFSSPRTILNGRLTSHPPSRCGASPFDTVRAVAASDGVDGERRHPRGGARRALRRYLWRATPVPSGASSRVSRPQPTRRSWASAVPSRSSSCASRPTWTIPSNDSASCGYESALAKRRGQNIGMNTLTSTLDLLTPLPISARSLVPEHPGRSSPATVERARVECSRTARTAVCRGARASSACSHSAPSTRASGSISPVLSREGDLDVGIVVSADRMPDVERITDLLADGLEELVRARARSARAMTSASEVLRECPLFEPLDDPTLATIAARCTTRHYEKNETVCTIGDPADELLVIAEGEVAVWASTRSPRTSVVPRPSARSHSCSASVRSATITTTRPTAVLVLGRADFDELVRTNVATTTTIAKILARRLRRRPTSAPAAPWCARSSAKPVSAGSHSISTFVAARLARDLGSGVVRIVLDDDGIPFGDLDHSPPTSAVDSGQPLGCAGVTTPPNAHAPVASHRSARADRRGDRRRDVGPYGHRRIGRGHDRRCRHRARVAIHTRTVGDRQHPPPRVCTTTPTAPRRRTAREAPAVDHRSLRRHARPPPGRGGCLARCSRTCIVRRRRAGSSRAGGRRTRGGEVALGAGAALGLAHIGVLRELEGKGVGDRHGRGLEHRRGHRGRYRNGHAGLGVEAAPRISRRSCGSCAQSMSRSPATGSSPAISCSVSSPLPLRCAHVRGPHDPRPHRRDRPRRRRTRSRRRRRPRGARSSNDRDAAVHHSAGARRAHAGRRRDHRSDPGRRRAPSSGPTW